VATYFGLVVLLAASLLSVGDRASASWEDAYDRSIQFFNHGDFETARAAAESGCRRWCAKPQSHACWSFRLTLAESLIELDRTKEARPLLDIAARSSLDEARRLTDLAQVHLRKSEDELVTQCLAKAQAAVPSTAHDILGNIYMIRGVLQLKKDQTSDAEDSFRRALAAVEGSNSLTEMYTLIDLGVLDNFRFRYDEALYWCGRASVLARQKGMQRVLSVALGNVGSASLSLGDLDRAVKNLGDAVRLAEELHDRIYLMQPLVLLGETWYRKGDLAKAAECYQKARALGNPATDKEWLSNVLDDLSQVELRKGDFSSADELNGQSVDLAEKLGRRDLILSHKVRSAAVAAARRKYARARKGYIDALESNRTVRDPIAAFMCHAGLASLYRETGEPSGAEREYRAATAVADEARANLWNDDSKFSFFATFIELYRDYVDFLVDRGDAAGAFRVAESCRARVLEEKLHREGEPPADLHVLEQEARDSGTILLSYWLAPKRSRLWAIDSDGLHPYTLPPEEEIESQVSRYNAAIENGDNPVESGQWLFANLLPARYRAPKDRNVVIEPDGVLHQLNFESLPAADGRYWIEDATVAIAPSLALLRQAGNPPSRRLLVFGDPGYDGKEFDPLPYVKTELEAVEKHFTNLSVFVHSAATPAAYRASNPQNYSILHFAAHAVGNRESPLDSAIVLAGPPDSRKLYAREILLHPLNADLVTLSACETAGSRTYHGEGLTGFSWAFLSAGARNVIAGIGGVSDSATASLMQSFYDELASGLTPQSALRRAKLALIARGGANRKPRYWAAFETFTKILYR
jgi:CHAT domain-containing protein